MNLSLDYSCPDTDTSDPYTVPRQAGGHLGWLGGTTWLQPRSHYLGHSSDLTTQTKPPQGNRIPLHLSIGPTGLEISPQPPNRTKPQPPLGLSTPPATPTFTGYPYWADFVLTAPANFQADAPSLHLSEAAQTKHFKTAD